MELKLNQVFVDQHDQAIKTEDKEFTLKDVCMQALLAPIDGENLDGAQKAKRFNLYMDIKTASDTINLEAEQIAELKKIIGKVFSVLIVGQAYRFLEGKQ